MPTKTLEIFQRVAKSEGITITQLEDNIGASRGVLSRAINKGTDVSGKWLIKLLEIYQGYSLEYLLKGEYPIRVSEVQEESKCYTSRISRKIESQLIPLYEIEASGGLVQLFNDINNQNPDEFLSIPNMPRCDGATYVVGDSMHPLLQSGDIVAFKKVTGLENVFWGEMYILSIHTQDEELIVVKYIQKSDLGDDYIKLVSENSKHEPKDIPTTKIQAIAIVKATIRFNTMS